jgi:3-oxoacyl-[acyl-carrier protein] reductase
MPERSLAGRLAVVTGADRPDGIGAGICRELAHAGADVAFTVRPRAAQSDGLAEELPALGVRAERFAIDLAAPDAAPRLLDDVCERLGTPRILVNNAAHSVRASFQTLDAAALDAHYAINVRTSALLCAELARRLGHDRAGRIVNLVSGQSLGPMPGELAYVASKGALEAFSVSLAGELAERGITVNAVNPGVTDTGWMTPEERVELLPRHPLGRFGLPQDVARLVAFLAGDDGGWITGQVLHSEGGFRR